MVYVGDSYEVIAGFTPFEVSINEGEGNKGGEIIDTLFHYKPLRPANLVSRRLTLRLTVMLFSNTTMTAF